MKDWTPTKHRRIYVRHEKRCALREGKARCNCSPTYRAEPTGAPKRSFKDINEAIGYVADVKRGIDTTPAPAPLAGGMTADDLMATFFAAARAGTALRKGGKTFSKRTIDKYERNWAIHFRSIVGNHPVAGLEARDWQLVVETVVATGQRDERGEPIGKSFTGSSVNGIWACVRSAYRWAASPVRQVVPANVTRLVEVPHFDSAKLKRALAPELIAPYLDTLHGRGKHGPETNPALRIAWALMFYAGLRSGEVRALDWSHVDLWANVLSVVDSKTSTGVRRVPILPALATILTDWRGDELRIGPVITGRRGARMGERSIASGAERRWTNAGLDVYAPHEARHTYASCRHAAGATLVELRDWLGHTNVAITDAYLHSLAGVHGSEASERVRVAYGA